MSAPHDELLRLMALAADLRAGGVSWPTVAERVGRHPDTVREWPRRYPRLWARFYARGESQRLREMSLECHGRLIQLMRSKNEHIQLAAAAFLARIREGRFRCEAKAEARKQAEASKYDDLQRQVVQFLSLLMGFNDDQVLARLKDLVARLEGPNPGRGSDAPPCPAVTG